jgi:hypothetical protein
LRELLSFIKIELIIVQKLHHPLRWTLRENHQTPMHQHIKPILGLTEEAWTKKSPSYSITYTPFCLTCFALSIASKLPLSTEKLLMTCPLLYWHSLVFCSWARN